MAIGRWIGIIICGFVLASCGDDASKRPALEASRESSDSPVSAPKLVWTGNSDGQQPLSLTASDGTGLKLVSLTARAVIDGPLAFTELRLVFDNPENRQREGRFEITLPPSAAISRFAMKIGQQWQEAEVVERQAAHAAYEDFLHRKQDPALLEKKAGNQFRGRVFPIAAGERKELIVSYSEQLVGEGRAYRMRLAGLPELEVLDVEILAAAPDGRMQRASATRTHGEANLQDLELRFDRPNGPHANNSPGDAHDSAQGLRFETLAMGRVRPKLKLQPAAMTNLTVAFDTSGSRALGYESQVTRLAGLITRLRERAGNFALRVVAYDQNVAEIYHGPAAGFAKAQREALTERKALGASNLSRLFDWLAAHPVSAKGDSRILLYGDGVVTAGEQDAGKLARLVSALGRRYTRLDAVVDGGIRDEPMLEGLVHGGLGSAGVLVDASSAQLVTRLLSQARSEVAIHVPGAEWFWPTSVNGLQSGDELLVFAHLPVGTPMHVVLEGVDDGSTALLLRPTQRPLLERAWVRADIARMTAKLATLEANDSLRKKLNARILKQSIDHRVLSDLTALLVLEAEADYRRFEIDRNALTDILTVGADGVELRARSAPKGRIPAAVRMAPTVATPRGEPLLSDSEVTIGLGNTGIIGAGVGAAGMGSSEGTIGLGNIGIIGGGVGAAGMGSRGFGSRAGGFRGRIERAPRIRTGRARVEGAMSTEVIRRIIRRHVNEVRFCYEQALASSPTLEGRLTIKFTIEPTGLAAGSTIKNSTVSNSVLERCLVKAVDRWRFPAPPDGRNVQVSCPFILQLPTPADRPSRARRPGLKRRRAGARAPRRARQASTVRGTRPRRQRPATENAYNGSFAEIMSLLAEGKQAIALPLALAWHRESPGNVLALVAMGECMEEAGELLEAARVYGTLIDLFPSRADLRRMAGERLDRLGRAGQGLALDSYEVALKQRPDHPSSHRLYAYALLEAGRFEDAFAAIKAGHSRKYPSGRYVAVIRILREDMGLIGAAWLAAEPDSRSRILSELGAVSLATKPSTRFVLHWETDANDVDLHVFDKRNDHVFYKNKSMVSGGSLYADVTTGYGPECFVVQGKPSAYPYTLQAHYFSRGPMGYGMGKLQILHHNGTGKIWSQSRPFIVMNDHAFVNLGTLTGPLSSPQAQTAGNQPSPSKYVPPAPLL